MVLHALNLVAVLAAERLVDVVAVGDHSGALVLIRVGVTFSKHSLSHNLVLLHHLNAEDVVDLDVMGGEAVVKEVRGEHHVVALVPELWVVLRVEEIDVAGAHKAEAREHKHSAPHPHEDARNVDGALGHTDKARQGRAHHSDDLVAENPVPVHHLHDSEQRMGGVLTLTHLVEAGKSADKARALGETLIHQVL